MNGNAVVNNFKEFMASSDDLSRLVLANTRLGIRLDPVLALRCVGRHESARRPVRDIVDRLETSFAANRQSTSQVFVPGSGANVADDHDDASFEPPRG